MQKLKNEIGEKKLQIRMLEQRMTGSFDITPHRSSNTELSQVIARRRISPRHGQLIR